MVSLNNLPITTAQPTDRPHILVWDTCDEDALNELRFLYGTSRINYAKNLVERHAVQSNSIFLCLDKRIDREIQFLRDLGTATTQCYIQLEGLDRLITYLTCTGNNNVELFWQKLIDLRQLPKLLWIILPSSLVHPDWPKKQLYTFKTF